MEKLLIIKIGGNIIDQEQALLSFLKDFASIPGKKILVHGGGKLVNSMALQLGVPQQLIDGRRITDAETLKIVTMLYAGVINKNITAQLQANGCDAIGLCGADANLILAHKRIHHSIDYGFAGDIDRISAKTFHQFLDFGLTPVMSPLTHDGKGQLLNTNADTIAQEIAKCLSGTFETSLIYLFEKSGVLLDPQDESTVISHIDPFYYRDLKEKKIIFAGMIPKLDNAFTALDHGVTQVMIGNARQLQQLITQTGGTRITNET